MAKEYAAAVDQGTTGTRFMIFDRTGQPVSAAYEEHQQIYPQPGWVEHDLVEIWEKTQKVIGAAMEKGGVKAEEIAGIGITTSGR